MTSVVLLWHTNETEKMEDAKLLGVYASPGDAEDAIGRLRDQPGFRNVPHDFQVSEYTLGKDHWTEGYISWDEAMEGMADGEE